MYYPIPSVLESRRYSVELCESYPNRLFVFGDNCVFRGTAGQASIRHCDNAIGIPTKRYPSMREDAFFTDDTFVDNARRIDTRIYAIEWMVDEHGFDEIVFAHGGLGTGMAKLPEKAPRTYQYLKDRVKVVFDIEWEE